MIALYMGFEEKEEEYCISKMDLKMSPRGNLALFAYDYQRPVLHTCILVPKWKIKWISWATYRVLTGCWQK